MKSFITTLTLLFIILVVSAQAPEKMSYQAIIRDNTNSLVINQSIGMQISVLQGSTTGSAVYVEIQTTTTNLNGLATIEIGNGMVVSPGNFASIDWSNGPFYIKTETDPTGGSNYSISGVSQLLSVPFALYAKTAEQIIGGITTKEILISPLQLNNSSNVMYPPGYPRQVILCPGDNSTVSGNTQIDIPIPSDWDGTDMNVEIYYSASDTGNLNMSFTLNTFAIGDLNYTSTGAGGCETVGSAYTLYKMIRTIYGSGIDPNDELMTIQLSRYDYIFAGMMCPDTNNGDAYIHGIRITYNANL